VKRRTIIAGLGAAGTAMAAGLYRFTDIFVKHYPPTPYDDVLALIDREQAAKLGAAALKAMPDFDAAKAAVKLRAARDAGGLYYTPAAQDADMHYMIEVDGWVVPESVALIAALAAKLS